MRPAHEVGRHELPERSATPIYDALYAEYRRLFRTLPFDRSGEEPLRFEGFGSLYPSPSAASTGFHTRWQEERRVRAALPPARSEGLDHRG
ncbi:hypothetical protein [Streptomyces alkaliterrae]|uniref:Uncharacterized protein n=1 Tax=Streptomyces alkaliterrae TaxID=2213162 RepID=A0A5P0YWF9_9ACTN|nr:hypothetical protein [Streptomyces alkaliterrae]MBB1258021.1 hypothetical protein [Streptomyces alkaliterrae]MQS04618.1 hypothetical protein [Streptomyces alkaliterrae]